MSLFDDASLIVTPNATKASKLYAIKPTSNAGDLDVVRATTATRVNSAGLIESVAVNAPRLDYTNSTCPSILVEPQRTNLNLRSEEFDNVAWSKSQLTITANTGISPSGVQNADTLTGTNVGVKQLFQPLVLIGSTNYTLSVYAKKSTNNFIQFLSAGTALGSSFYANFDLNNGVIGNYNNTVGLPTITDVGNGWYRCVVTATSVAVPSIGAGMSISLITSATSIRAESNSLTTSVFLWGAQLEVGSNATSYIPTVASTVTRNADVISKTGISSLIGQTEGTLYFEGNLTANDMTIASLRTDGGLLNGVIIDVDTDKRIKAYIVENNAQRSLVSGLSTITFNSFIKIAYVYKSGNSSLFINGVKQNTSNQTFTFNNTLLRLNIDFVGYNFGALQGKTKYVKSVLVFPTQLTDTQAVQLTTL